MLLRNLLVLLLISLGCALSSCSNSSGEGASSGSVEASSAAEIDITVNGASAGTVRLGGYFGAQQFLVDTFQMDAKGRVTLSRPDSVFPWGYYVLILPDDQNYVQLLLGADQEFSMETELSDVNGKMKVKGDPSNELYYENIQWETDYNKRITPINSQLEGLTEGTPEWEKLRTEQKKLIDERTAHVSEITSRNPSTVFSIFKTSGQNPPLKEPKGVDGTTDRDAQIWYYRNEYWNNVDFGAEWLIRTPVFQNKLENYIKKYTPQNIDSLKLYASKLLDLSKQSPELFKHAANWIALEYKEPEFMGGNEVYAHVIRTCFTEDQMPWEKKENLLRVRGDARVIQN